MPITAVPHCDSKATYHKLFYNVDPVARVRTRKKALAARIPEDMALDDIPEVCPAKAKDKAEPKPKRRRLVPAILDFVEDEDAEEITSGNVSLVEVQVGI